MDYWMKLPLSELLCCLMELVEQVEKENEAIERGGKKVT